jgi:glycine cleavage system H protein
MTPTDRKYAKTHEWVKLDGTTAIVGITDHAQDALGDITFVELPEVGAHLKKNGECGVVESVKAASDIYSPLSGEVAQVNENLETTPEDINTDPYDKGWIFTIKNLRTDEVAELMDAAAYEAFIESEQQ